MPRQAKLEPIACTLSRDDPGFPTHRPHRVEPGRPNGHHSLRRGFHVLPGTAATEKQWDLRDWGPGQQQNVGILEARVTTGRGILPRFCVRKWGKNQMVCHHFPQRVGNAGMPHAWTHPNVHMKSVYFTVATGSIRNKFPKS